MGFDSDVLILGSGPAGYVAGIRAAQLGMKALVVEKGKTGGVCLNRGCIPTKALIKQAEDFLSLAEVEKTGVKVDRSGFQYKSVFETSRKASESLSKGVQYLLKKNGVGFIQGTARISGPHQVTLDDGRVLTGKNLLLATGSRPRQIPGFEFDGTDILSSDHALFLEELPARMLIIGGGAIGCEFAHVMNAFGVEVTVAEMMDHLLPQEDPDTAAIVERAFRKRKIDLRTGARVAGYQRREGELVVPVTLKDGTAEELVTDKILVVTGRAQNTDDLGLERVGIVTERGAVPVNSHYQTVVPSIYAVGDIIASPQLAHLASAEGEAAVEHMAGKGPEHAVDPLLVPRGVYTDPQVAGFGLTETNAKAQGKRYAVSLFSYRAAGKAVATGKTDGQVKLVYDPDTKEILGAGIVGADATEIIHEVLLAKKSGLKTEDIAGMIHAHPTLSEAIMEAARGAEGWMIHA